MYIETKEKGRKVEERLEKKLGRKRKSKEMNKGRMIGAEKGGNRLTETHLLFSGSKWREEEGHQPESVPPSLFFGPSGVCVLKRNL